VGLGGGGGGGVRKGKDSVEKTGKDYISRKTGSKISCRAASLGKHFTYQRTKLSGDKKHERGGTGGVYVS